MFRIVIVLNRLVIGGAPFDTIQLAGFLSSHYDVYLLVGEKNKGELDASFLTASYPDLKVIQVSSIKRSVRLFGDIRAFFSIRKILKSIQPHVVHTNGAKPGLLGRLAAASLGVPVILHTYHGHVFHSYFNRFLSAGIVQVEKLMAFFSTRIITISRHLEQELLQVYRICRPEKLSVIQLGINAQQFVDETGMKREAFRNYFLLAPDEIAVGIIGRVVPIKGHGFFLDIVQELLTHSNPRLRFFIIGDGELCESIQTQATQKKIPFTYFPDQPIVAPLTFTSWLINMDEVMAGLDIVALTSLNEGMPVALLEAQAAAKPVISTNAGSVAEAVIPGRSGFIVPYGETKEFAAHILKLAGDTGLRRQMGEEGRIFVNTRYYKQKELNGMSELYEKLLQGLKPES